MRTGYLHLPYEILVIDDLLSKKLDQINHLNKLLDQIFANPDLSLNFK